MSIHKRLGVYWGESGLTLVETKPDNSLLATFVSFEIHDQSEIAKRVGVSNDLKILEILQKAIRNKGFSTLNAYIALPSKDILIRSFVLPWMKSSEIHGTVAFEAKKYIPFNIEEIAYTYYPTTITQGGLRQIGIIFAGIHKNTLSKYTNVFIQSGLNVVYSEPAAMSLLRILVHKRLIVEDHYTAILNVMESSGELIIASKGHINFYRDFKTNVEGGSSSVSGGGDDVVRARVFNEVRLSFEFFSRQQGGSEINKLIVLSSGRDPSFWTGLSEESAAPLEVVDSSKLFDVEGVADICGASALGATMSGNVLSVIDFNLFEDASTQVSLKKEEVVKKNKQLILPGLVGTVAAGLIVFIAYFSDAHLNGIRFQMKTLTSKVGTYVDTALEDIQTMTTEEQKKLQAVQTLPVQSRVSPLVVRFIKRMPKRMTLESFRLLVEDQDGSGAFKINTALKTQPVRYTPIKSKYFLTVDAVLHITDTNMAFSEANQFINQLRKDDLFSSKFQRVTLSALKSQAPVGKTKSTTLTITCEGQ